MTSQVKDYSRRLHISPTVTSQALEYGRLSELKCPRGSIPLSCIAVICIELASAKLGEPLDKKQAQKLSGVQPKAYRNSYQTVEKMLDLCSLLKVRELAVRFGCLEAIDMAEDILRCYREGMQEKYSAAQMKGFDFDKPLYTAAALYHSCKLQKIQSNKTKFLNSSTSSKTVFDNVLDEMKKFVPDTTDESKKKSRKRNLTREDLADDLEEIEKVKEVRVSGSKRETLHSRILSDPTSEEYQKWKEMTIKQARTELNVT